MRLFQCWRRYKSQPNIIIHKYSKSSAKTSSIKMERKGLREEKKAKKKAFKTTRLLSEKDFHVIYVFRSQRYLYEKGGQKHFRKGLHIYNEVFLLLWRYKFWLNDKNNGSFSPTLKSSHSHCFQRLSRSSNSKQRPSAFHRNFHTLNWDKKKVKSNSRNDWIYHPDLLLRFSSCRGFISEANYLCLARGNFPPLTHNFCHSKWKLSLFICSYVCESTLWYGTDSFKVEQEELSNNSWRISFAYIFRILLSNYNVLHSFYINIFYIANLCPVFACLRVMGEAEEEVGNVKWNVCEMFKVLHNVLISRK